MPKNRKKALLALNNILERILIKLTQFWIQNLEITGFETICDVFNYRFGSRKRLTR